MRTCLMSTIISILVYGSSSEEVVPQKGLRQGDPISPFLFIITVEGLDILLSRAKELGLIRGVNIGSEGLNLSHLQFVDDTILFCEADWVEVTNVKRILRCFEVVFGLKINYHKSAISGVGIEEESVVEFASRLNCPCQKLPFKYLEFRSPSRVHLLRSERSSQICDNPRPTSQSGERQERSAVQFCCCRSISTAIIKVLVVGSGSGNGVGREGLKDLESDEELWVNIEGLLSRLENQSFCWIHGVMVSNLLTIPILKRNSDYKSFTNCFLANRFLLKRFFFFLMLFLMIPIDSGRYFYVIVEQIDLFVPPHRS
ncbi:uncharacterized protein LOC114300656, partial [Camellia sinensis]|uniref:uncharacterized protein LOC114300656 n=1 Tax=Camellia sinensis TaxID=4442 RepID=UPI001035F1C1